MDVEGWNGVWRLGKEEIVYLSLRFHHQNDSCIKMGSDESRFNVSLIVRKKDSVHRPHLLKRNESRSGLERSGWLNLFKADLSPKRY